MHDNDKRSTPGPGNMTATALTDEDLWMSDTDLWEDELPNCLGGDPGHIPANERPRDGGSSVIARGMDLGMLCASCGLYRLDEPA